MEKILKISMAAVIAYALGFAMAALVVSTQSSAVSAQEQAAPAKEEKTDEKQEQAAEYYTYKAQAGDSYSQMARKAVQTYGIENKVSLTPAGIIYAETAITNAADAELLEVGQEVKILKDVVKKYVDEAEKLSDKQQKAWGYYVQFVEFNTNNVGEA